MEMSANFDAEIAERIKANSQNTEPENGLSRVEDINARLARLERQHADLAALGDDQKRNIIKARTDEVIIRVLGDMDILVQVLAMERPATAREALIFALRALSPMQQAARLIPDGYKNEIAMANAGCRLLRGLIPALEALSGTSRADLSCDPLLFQPASTDDVIEGLRVPLTKTEPASI
jgi:hypothetical protein